MIIQKVNTRSTSDVKKFIAFSFELYIKSPFWVPPFISDMRNVMDRDKHPYYAHSDADFYLAVQNGKVLGRIALLEKRKYNEYHNEKCAFFYFFDTVNEQDVAMALFQQAEMWARERALTNILGPFGFIQGDSIGILVDGHDRRPALGQAYNYDYYNDLVQSAGFSKKADFYSGYLRGDHQLPERFFSIADNVKQKRGFWIKSFGNKKELRDWIEPVQQVYNAAFSHNLGYSPMSLEEAHVVAHRLLAIGNPRLIKLVMKGEDIIGFLFAFVDITDGLRKTRGRMWPVGWTHLARDLKKTEWINFNGTGILPGHRGLGANAVLYTEMARTVKEFGFKHADVVQIEEQNVKSMGDMSAIGVQWYKKHRVYEKILR
ncbi:hypothetical protein EH223_03030 [candidate division KSB1 bacterium]|nr:hypothetical protein [candidate division KSB1 bacterium]RQW06115.1 MAG: hypothetical protein EH223_03030 [candidate division KSB1 bacterium]